MLLPSFLSVGAIALTANAFLVPGDLDDFSGKGFAHPAVTIQDIKTAVLDCSTCPYAFENEHDGTHGWANGVASELMIDVLSDGNTLRFPSGSFYPIPASGLPPTLQGQQTKKEDDPSPLVGYPAALNLSYSLEYYERKSVDGDSLLTFLLTVMGLEGQMVQIDNVEIKAIKDAEGQVCTPTLTLLVVSFFFSPLASLSSTLSLPCRPTRTRLTQNAAMFSVAS